MKKYCIVNSGTKVSRFFQTRQQALNRVRFVDDIVMTKSEVIDLGIYVEPKRKQTVQYVDMRFSRGLQLTDEKKYPNMWNCQRLNEQRYHQFCKSLGSVIPI